jgi:hypothetical protein
MIWWYIATFVVALVVASALAPKPQTQAPAGFGDVQVPTAQEGREIPVLFGTRCMRGPNVCWYGDFETIPVQKRV